MIELLTEQTNLYRNQDSNDPDFKTTRAEIKRFIGIYMVLLLTDYHSLPHEDHYWSNSPDLGVPVISETLSDKRYHIAKKYLHLADNQNKQSGDKVAVVSPLCHALNDNLVQFRVWHADRSVDESMVPYYGRHGMKTFIRGKPIRLGFKIWVLYGIDGFPYRMKIYVGKEDGVSADPRGTRVIDQMVKGVTAHSSYQYHTFFFDNFFYYCQVVGDLE